MRRAFRIALTIGKWVAIVSGATLLVVILANARDEELTSATKALAEYHPPSVPDAQNAYLVLIGFDAPAGSDPIVAGASLVAENNASALSDPSGWGRMSKRSAKEPGAENRSQLKFVGSLNALHDSLDGKCLSQALEHAHDIRSMIDANPVLVARYLAMQRLPAYASTSVPDILQTIPPSDGWLASRRLLQMQSCLDAQTAHVGRGLEFLAADTDMWRRVLGNGGLLEEMIAVRVLASDFRVLSDLIATPAFDARANEAKLRQILAPLSDAELNMALTFKREFEMHARMYAALPGEMAKDRSVPWFDRLINRYFYLPNASLNESAQLFGELQAVASHPPSEFVVGWDKLQNAVRAQSTLGVRWIYNPLGRMTAGMVIPTYKEYITRVFDLAAYVNLVRAQLELRLAAVPSTEVPAILTAARPETRNPYTKQPFQWNASDKSLSFEPMSSRWREWSTKVVLPHS